VKRALAILAATLGGIYVVYLVAANALLKLGGVAKFVNDGTDDAHLEIGGGHSWFPGRVEVRDLALRFEDVNVQFQIVVERATASLSLTALARKRVHLGDLEAHGVRFLFRHKVMSVAGNERRLPHFPRIAGFADPPILKPEPPTDKTKNWAIQLDDVRAHGVELWFMEYRYSGSAEVTGSFALFPGRSLRVGPARVIFTAGELGIGARRPLARRVHGSLDFRFREANPDPIPGLEIFRQVSAKAALDAEVFDLEAANLYLSDASGVAVRRGRSVLAARLELRDGRFVPDSFMTLRGTEPVHVVLPTSAASARLDAEVRTRGRDAGPARLAVATTLERVGMSLDAATTGERPDVSVNVAKASLATDHADVARPWKLEEASFRVEGGVVEDLRALDTGDGGMLEGGALWFFANAELAPTGAWSAAGRADTRRLRLRLGERRSVLDGSFMFAADSPRRDLSEGALRDVALEITSAEQRDGEPLSASVRMSSVEWQGFPPKVLRGRANFTAPHSDPLFEAVGAPSLLVSLWPDAPVDASARFVYERDAFDLRLDRVKSGAFRAMGRLKVCSPPKGAFVVKNGAFSVGVSVRDGEMRVVPLAGDDWLAENAPVCPGN
jgi:hypothetical protein